MKDHFLKRIIRQREFMIVMIVLVMFVIMAFASPAFLNRINLLALVLGMSIEVIIGVAMVNLMVSGGIDMSVGSVLAFTGSTTAYLLKSGVPVLPAVLAGLAISACIGLFNGFIVAKVGINPFVTTLASLSMFRGLTLIVTQGLNISPLPDAFNQIGQNVFLGVQTPIWIALAFLVLGDVLLRKSRFFRQNYFIGGNEKSARFSGIPVDRMKTLNYVFTGLFAGIAGVVMTARLGTASTTAGSGLELRVITAVIIGGASLQGGEGSVLGAFFGTLLMALIANSMNLLGVDVYWQTFVVGATLLAAVIIDRYGKIKNSKQVKNNTKLKH